MTLTVPAACESQLIGRADAARLAVIIDLLLQQNGGVAGSASLGYQKLTSLNTAKALTIPAGAVQAVMIAEGQPCRFRVDGTDPTASTGFPLNLGTIFTTSSDLATMKIIEQAASATVHILYY